MDPWRRPPQVNRPLDQSILIPLAFEMVLDLPGSRLANIDIGILFTVTGRNLVMRMGGRIVPPVGCAGASDVSASASRWTASRTAVAGQSGRLRGGGERGRESPRAMARPAEGCGASLEHGASTWASS